MQSMVYAVAQGDHLSGKPGIVREYDCCQGNAGILLKIREMSGKIFSGKICLKSLL